MSSGPESTEPQVPAPEHVARPDGDESASAGRESVMLRNLAAAQHVRIAALQARLDDDEATGDAASPAPIPNWPRSVVEELAWTRARLDEARHKTSQLERALADRTRWARDLENEALARTRWALASDQRLQRYARALDRALGPGDDDAELFLMSSALLWRATWPLRFVYRLAGRFFARRLWNPLEWPGWFRRMKAAYAAHGARGFLHVGTRTERDPESRRRR